jgi:hypothetical protein
MAVVTGSAGNYLISDNLSFGHTGGLADGGTGAKHDHPDNL